MTKHNRNLLIQDKLYKLRNRVDGINKMYKNGNKLSEFVIQEINLYLTEIEKTSIEIKKEIEKI